MVAHHDYAANNGGLLLTMDVVISLVGLALVIWHAIAGRHQTDITDATADQPQQLVGAGR